MQHTSATLTDTKTLANELDELDQLLHRIRTRLIAPANKRETQLSHWRKMRGVLKMPAQPLTITELGNALQSLGNLRTLRAKLPKDPVAWQRKMRSEEDRHRSKLLAPYLKALHGRRQ